MNLKSYKNFFYKSKFLLSHLLSNLTSNKNKLDKSFGNLLSYNFRDLKGVSRLIIFIAFQRNSRVIKICSESLYIYIYIRGIYRLEKS